MTKNKSRGAQYILLGSKTAKITPCFPEKNPIGGKDGRGRSKFPAAGDVARIE